MLVQGSRSSSDQWGNNLKSCLALSPDNLSSCWSFWTPCLQMVNSVSPATNFIWIHQRIYAYVGNFQNVSQFLKVLRRIIIFHQESWMSRWETVPVLFFLIYCSILTLLHPEVCHWSWEPWLKTNDGGKCTVELRNGLLPRHLVNIWTNIAGRKCESSREAQRVLLNCLTSNLLQSIWKLKWLNTSCMGELDLLCER